MSQVNMLMVTERVYVDGARLPDGEAVRFEQEVPEVIVCESCGQRQTRVGRTEPVRAFLIKRQRGAWKDLRELPRSSVIQGLSDLGYVEFGNGEGVIEASMARW